MMAKFYDEKRQNHAADCLCIIPDSLYIPAAFSDTGIWKKGECPRYFDILYEKKKRTCTHNFHPVQGEFDIMANVLNFMTGSQPNIGTVTGVLTMYCKTIFWREGHFHVTRSIFQVYQDALCTNLNGLWARILCIRGSLSERDHRIPHQNGKDGW